MHIVHAPVHAGEAGVHWITSPIVLDLSLTSTHLSAPCSNKLSRSKPLPRVMSAPLLLSTCLQLVVVIVFQRAALELLAAQPGYVRFRGDKGLQDVVVSGAKAEYAYTSEV